ncbi:MULTISPECIES: extracellular solute-binding protein [unclassified Arenimonas]|uniref:extracellular solute-binding protein n=1 Tax=unclassified Arenimonas TaxID=2641713 RepID=UPI00086C2788|nr:MULTISPECIES: extracellular solute-binding protein [unclassified Arenimonas]ODS64497.1 MAG: Fe(3+) ABC transporter substrate-binding protein [Arenimonas sp. SCN 70-307]
MSRPLIALLLASLFAPALQAAELVVYTERREPLVKPLFERYERETGTKVRVLSDGAPVLIERIAAEGANTRADVFMAVDAGNLWQAAERGLLAPVKSPALEAAIPAHLRDPQGRWFALSQRARTLVYSTARVRPTQLSTYEDLADPRWKGKLCLRSSKKVYNQSLVATMIERLGAERTEAVVRGWVANLATAPFADDTQLAKAVAAGQCDVGIINTYYLGRLQADEPGFPVQVFWADQGGAGAHVNVSGAGVVAASKNQAAAIKFLEWLASESVQADFASINYEIPAREGSPLDPIVAAWGPFKADQVNVAVAGQRQAEAVRLMDRAGWR